MRDKRSHICAYIFLILCMSFSVSALVIIPTPFPSPIRYSPIVNISECTNLNRANTIYMLQKDISKTPILGQCFIISANNVTLDGNGHSVFGNGWIFGLSAISSIQAKNIFIKNLRISGFIYGIISQGSENVTVLNVLLKSITSTAILVDSTKFMTISMVNISGSDQGIIVSAGSRNVSLSEINITQASYGVSVSKSFNTRLSNILVKSNKYGINFDTNSNTLLTKVSGINNTLNDFSCNGALNNSGSGNLFEKNRVKQCSDGFPIHPLNYLYPEDLSSQSINYINITSCQKLNQSNATYILIQNIINNNLSGPCLNITAPNIFLDCHANSIISNSAASGIYSDQLNTNIQNCIVNMKNSSGGVGIFLASANNSYLLNDTMNYNYFGVYIVSSKNVTIENSTANSNFQHGFYLTNSGYSKLINNYLEANNFKGVFLENSNYITSIGNTIYSSYHGFAVEGSNNNLFFNNTLMGNAAGVRSVTCTNNTYINNDFSYNYFGTFFYSGSDSIVFINNTVNNNDLYGIYLISSSRALIDHNTANDNYQYGIVLSGSSNNTITYNFANNNQGVNIPNPTYPSAGIFFGSSSNNILANNNATYNKWGIYLGASSDNNVANNFACYNNVSNGGSDLYCVSSLRNSGIGNTFTYTTQCDLLWPNLTVDYNLCPCLTNDSDKDGVCDTVDNCKFVPNPRQEDKDHDGIGDACDTDLIADYEFGGNFSDSSGNNYYGVPLGNVSIQNSTGLPIAKLDGATGYVNVPGPINLSNRGFTLSAWAKVDDILKPRHYILSQGNKSLNNGLHFGFGSNAGIFTFRFYYDDLDTNITADTQWHQWVGSFNPITRERIIYKDGILVARDIALGNYTGSGNITIGTTAWLNSVDYFNGSLDQVKIFDRVMQPQEILNMYNNSKGFFMDSDADGIVDILDNCPFNYNPDQLDKDSDGRGDACDFDIYIGSLQFDPVTENSLPKNLVTANESGYFVVQADDGYQDYLFSVMDYFGATLIDTIPTNAFLYYTNLTKSAIASLDHIRFVDIYQPAYKFSPYLYDLAVSGNLSTMTDQTVVVISVFKNIEGVKQQIIQLGGTAVQPYSPDDINFNTTLLVNISWQYLINLSYLADVQTIDIGVTSEPDLATATLITNVRTVRGGPNLLGLTGANQIIGFRDTGVDTGNAGTLIADLRGRVASDPAAAHWDDLNGHGTHVVGTAIGNGANSGADGIIGVAPLATGFFRPFAADPAAAWPPMITILQAAYTAGARIHSNSWGVRGLANPFPWILNQYHQTDREVDTFTRSHPDLLFVKAAGNEGVNQITHGIAPNTISSPGTAKNSLTIGASENTVALLAPPAGSPLGANFLFPFALEYTNGATVIGTYHVGSRIPPIANQADSAEDVADFSSRGMTPDHRIKPDVVAPGAWILSTRSSVCQAPFDNGDGRSDRNGDGVTDHNDCVGDGLPGGPYAGYGANYVVTNIQRANPPGPPVNVYTNLVMRANDVTAFVARLNALFVGPFTNTAPVAIPSNTNLPGRAALGASYMYESGTSMATPHVSGMAALIRQYLMTMTNTPQPTGELLKAFIINGAQRLQNGEDIPNGNEGWGRVNLSKSITPCDPNRCVFFDYADGTSRKANISTALSFNIIGHWPYVTTVRVNDTVRNYTLRLSMENPVEATLAWYDAPGASLINDLDLLMNAPGNLIYRGGVNSIAHSVSVPGQGKDSVNNVEKLIVPAIPDDGFYNFSVEGFINPASPWQTYALVISGVRGIDSTNITTNYTYAFSSGDFIYAKGPGFPNLTDVNVHVVKYDGTQRWNANVNLSAISYNLTTIRTDRDGAIQNTIVWNASNMTQIFDAKGKFNLVVDIGKDGWYNKSRDLVDYHRRYGFRVQAVSSANNNGVLTKVFRFNESVFARGVGFSNNTNISIYVIKYDSSRTWAGDIRLDNIALAVINTTTDANGEIATIKAWNDTNLSQLFETEGRYNLVVDTGKDNFYNMGKDTVDNKFSYGFRIEAISSANSTGEINKVFNFGDTIYAIGVGFESQSNFTANIDAYNASVDWKSDIRLNPITQKNITVPESGKFGPTLLWKADNLSLIMDSGGWYNIIADLGKDGFYNSTIDVVDNTTTYGFRVQTITTTNANSNITKVFRFGDSIYARGVGFAESGFVNLTVVAFDSSNKFDSNFKLVPFNKPLAVGISSGKIPNTLIMIADNITKIFNASGRFNLVGDIGGDGFYNSSKDAVDNKTGYGFRIEAVSAANVSGDINKVFNFGDTIYAVGVGFESQSNLTANIVAYNGSVDWLSDITLNPLTQKNITVEDTGKFGPAEMWKTDNLSLLFETGGWYNIVADLGKDGYYNSTIDVVDYPKTYGFRVQTITTTNYSSNITKVFQFGDQIYAKGVGFGESGFVNLTVINFKSSNNFNSNFKLEPVNILFGTAISSGKVPNTLIMVANNITQIINASGRFNLIGDIGDDGFYNASKDAVDNKTGYGFRVEAIVTTNGSGDIKNVFNFGDLIYGKGVGFADALTTNLVITEYNASNLWDNDVNINNVSTKPATANAGVIGPMVIWEANDLVKILESSARYNLITDKNKDGAYNTTDDVVDNKGNFGFRVQTISSVNSSGNITKHFNYRDTIYARASGFDTYRNIRIYVIPYNATRDWKSDINLSSISFTGTYTSPAGKIDTTMIWTADNLTKIFNAEGKFNIVVDLDQDGFYNASVDVVDNKTGYGFIVQAIAAANSTGNLTKEFIRWADIYAIGVGFPPNKEVKIYATNDSDSWADGTTLFDETPSVDTVTTTADGKIPLTLIWKRAREGTFDIAADVNEDGKYSMGLDTIDDTIGYGFRVSILCPTTQLTIDPGVAPAEPASNTIYLGMDLVTYTDSYGYSFNYYQKGTDKFNYFERTPSHSFAISHKSHSIFIAGLGGQLFVWDANVGYHEIVPPSLVVIELDDTNYSLKGFKIINDPDHIPGGAEWCGPDDVGKVGNSFADIVIGSPSGDDYFWSEKMICKTPKLEFEPYTYVAEKCSFDGNCQGVSDEGDSYPTAYGAYDVVRFDEGSDDYYYKSIPGHPQEVTWSDYQYIPMTSSPDWPKTFKSETNYGTNVTVNNELVANIYGESPQYTTMTTGPMEPGEMWIHANHNTYFVAIDNNGNPFLPDIDNLAYDGTWWAEYSTTAPYILKNNIGQFFIGRTWYGYDYAFPSTAIYFTEWKDSSDYTQGQRLLCTGGDIGTGQAYISDLDRLVSVDSNYLYGDSTKLYVWFSYIASGEDSTSAQPLSVSSSSLKEMYTVQQKEPKVYYENYTVAWNHTLMKGDGIRLHMNQSNSDFQITPPLTEALNESS